MPRKYPDQHTNYLGQTIKCGDRVVFITSTSRKYEGLDQRRLLVGTVIKMNMNTVRIEYARVVQPWPVNVEVRPGYWERVTPPEETRIVEVNAKPDYCYVLGS